MEVWVSFAAAVIALGSLAVSWTASRDNKRVATAQVFLSYLDRFESPAIRSCRSAIGTAFTAAKTPDEDHRRNVLNALEQMAVAAKTSVLDSKLLWDNLADWFLHNWYAFKTEIDADRRLTLNVRRS